MSSNDAQRATDLLGAVTGGYVITPQLFEGVELDLAMDIRDASLFESEWLRVDSVIRELLSQIPANELNVVQSLADAAHEHTYAITKHSEVAAQVYDDFELFGLALCLDLDDPWLNALWTAYSSGTFPHGTLVPRPGPIRILVAEFSAIDRSS